MNKQSTRIVVVGGGFGGVFSALDLIGSGEVTLINQEDHFLFTPMLYEYLSGEVEAWHIAPSFRELLDDKVRVIKGAVSHIDFTKREVAIEGRSRTLGYDILILAVGSTTNYFNVEGARDYAIPFRKLEDADRLRRRMTDAIDKIAPDAAPQDATAQATFAVIGGGASGVETATKMVDLLNDAFARRGLPGVPRVMVIEMGDRIIPGMGGDLREYVEQSLREARVEIHTETRVTKVTARSVAFEHNGVQKEIETAAVVWTGGVRVSPLVESLDLQKDERDKIAVRETLQTFEHPEVFALGDVARYDDADARLSGTAQLANQQAGLVATNVQAYLKGEALTTKHFADLGAAVSLGTERAAVASSGTVVHGALARQARFALYTSRLPTWHHRLKVGASWFLEGTQPRPLGE